MKSFIVKVSDPKATRTAPEFTETYEAETLEEAMELWAEDAHRYGTSADAKVEWTEGE